MTTKTKFTRFAIALVLALSVIGFSAPAVLADQPVMFVVGPITDGMVFTNLCAFPVTYSTTYTVFGTDFFDQGGALIKSHYHLDTQGDTFTANGKTLLGLPLTANAEVRWDGAGNITSFYVNGVLEKVPLQKGIFNAAGRANMIGNPYGFLLTPDNGNPGNIAAFCAALAP